MSRRVKLPGASELFRPTETVSPIKPVPVEAVPEPKAAGGTGRVRHEEKITVYVSRDELLALEQARLKLRGELGLAVDRGRLVRAAIAYALTDLETAGPEGELVRRLTAS